MALTSPQRAQSYRAWMRALGVLVLLELLVLLAGIAFGGWRWSWPPQRGADWLLTVSILLLATLYAWLRTAARHTLERHRHQ